MSRCHDCPRGGGTLTRAVCCCDEPLVKMSSAAGAALERRMGEAEALEKMRLEELQLPPPTGAPRNRFERRRAVKLARRTR